MFLNKDSLSYYRRTATNFSERNIGTIFYLIYHLLFLSFVH